MLWNLGLWGWQFNLEDVNPFYFCAPFFLLEWKRDKQFNQNQESYDVDLTHLRVYFLIFNGKIQPDKFIACLINVVARMQY